MRRLTHILLVAALLLALGWTFWTGLRQRRESADPDETGEAAESKPAGGEEKVEAFVVQLDEERLEALGLAIAKPEAAELKPQRVAYGRVLDPLPLIALEGEVAAADAALAASRAESERSQKLLAAGENTSRKNAESAQAQFRTDESKVAGLQRRAALEWGDLLPMQDAAARNAFIDQIVRGEIALIRVDLLPADALAEIPQHARLSVLGREAQPVETPFISAAAAVDPQSQAQGFILRVEHPPFPLRSGMAITAWLESREEPRSGCAVPRSAVLRHDGRTWVYVREASGKFVRTRVNLEAPLEGDRGWFVAAESGGVAPDDELVITGAQSLLSEELNGQGGADED